MDPITVDDVQARSRLDFVSLGYPDDDALQPLVDEAIAYVAAMTCRTIDEIPEELAAIAYRAVTMRVEQILMTSHPEYVESAADDLIQSFSTPGYSETKRSGSS